MLRAIWKRLRITKDAEDGAVMLTVSVAFIAILSAIAFALDLGVMLAEHREARNAADNAALAAVWADCHEESPWAAAYSSIGRNDYTAADLTLTKVTHGTFTANVETSVDLNFAGVIGVDAATVHGSATASCFLHAGSRNAIFAWGSCAGYGKPTLDVSGSMQRVYGGVHANDHAKVGGSDNDFGPGDPGVDPFTYENNFNDFGLFNVWDPGYPVQTAWEPFPLQLELRDYSPGSANATAAAALGNYFYVEGNIDGAYVEANGEGLYYATGNIKLDKEVTLAVTFVAEGVVEFAASNQTITPYVDGLLAFGGHPYGGIESCDKFVVSMSGSSSNWSGIVFGPNGLIEFAGSSNSTFTGSMVAHTVRLNGSDVTIKSDPDLIPPSYSPKLIE